MDILTAQHSPQAAFEVVSVSVKMAYIKDESQREIADALDVPWSVQ